MAFVSKNEAHEARENLLLMLPVVFFRKSEMKLMLISAGLRKREAVKIRLAVKTLLTDGLKRDFTA